MAANMSPSEMVQTNENLLAQFMSGLDNVSETTKNDYHAKLRNLMKHVQFDADENDIESYLNTVPNPNTRSNKANAIIRLRKSLDLPYQSIQSYREGIRSDIRQHRKLQAKANLDKLVSYDELMTELDKLSGAQYFMNYMYAKHGLRNQDINCVYRNRVGKGEKVTENTLTFNPKAKNPRMLLKIVDYKTANVYGPKEIEMKDPRLFAELKGMNLKNKQYIFGTQSGKKPTLNHMNVRAMKESINKYGEGRIAKILVKHLIDTDNHEAVAELSKTRGTALSTLYTHYNTYDNKL